MYRIKLLMFFALLVSAADFSAAGDIVHIMKKGDTLYDLSKKYDVPVSLILEKNDIKDPDKIYAGTEITIPGSDRVYVVKKGDTLYSIAKKNNSTVEKLKKINDLPESGILMPGMKLIIVDEDKEERCDTAIVKIAAADKNKEAEIDKAPDKKTQPSKQGVSDKKKEDYLWPVHGSREKLSGKLKGSLISAEKGAVVCSVSSGKVVWEGEYRGMGRIIFVESKTGYLYIYGGNENTLVKVGDKVIPGTELGIPFSNVRTGKSNVYFSVYKDGTPMDEAKAPRS